LTAPRRWICKFPWVWAEGGGKGLGLWFLRTGQSYSIFLA